GQGLNGAKGEGVAPVETAHPALWMLTEEAPVGVATRALSEAEVAEPATMPAAAMKPTRPHRGLLPAGIGLVLLGATGAATALLLLRQEWLLAILTVLIGGLVATHLGGVRAKGTLYGGA